MTLYGRYVQYIQLLHTSQMEGYIPVYIYITVLVLPVQNCTYSMVQYVLYIPGTVRA